MNVWVFIARIGAMSSLQCLVNIVPDDISEQHVLSDRLSTLLSSDCIHTSLVILGQPKLWLLSHLPFLQKTSQARWYNQVISYNMRKTCKVNHKAKW